MKLIPVRKDLYEEYRLTLMFDCYKWDPQFLDGDSPVRPILTSVYIKGKYL